MIIDRIRLSGKDAYLQDNGDINLAQSATQTGVTGTIPEGKTLDVSTLQLYLESEDLHKLLPRESGKPLILIQVVKEMFPNMYADPYTHRVHQIGGFEDFQRGRRIGLRAMEVDGIATLVATLPRDNLRWISPQYKLPKPITLTKASWDLALSKLTPDDVFEYGIKVEVWQNGQNIETEQGKDIVLAPTDTKPSTDRFNQTLSFAGPNPVPVSDVIAYQVHFAATVHHDTYFEEQHVGLKTTESIGSPLLQAVNLLEQTESALSFYSLHELLAESFHFHVFDQPTPSRVMVKLDMSAVLTEGERIQLTVSDGAFKRVEARLDAEIRLRPPLIDREAV